MFFYDLVFVWEARLLYAKGSRETNVCPADGWRLLTEAECRSAAEFFGMNFESTVNWASSPKGCLTSEWDDRGVFYNSHESGTQQSNQAPICGKMSGKFLFTNLHQWSMFF